MRNLLIHYSCTSLYGIRILVHYSLHGDFAVVYVMTQSCLKGVGIFYDLVREGIDPTNERQQNGERYSVTLFERKARAARTSAHGGVFIQYNNGYKV